MLPGFRKRGPFPGWMDDFFGDLIWPELEVRRGNTMPAVNIIEEDNQYRIEVAAPGMTKKDFHIDLEDSVLTISSEKEEENEDKKKRYMRKEYSYCAFKRSFSLPGTVTGDDIKASYHDGVLDIHIPKKEEMKGKLSRRIEIA